MIARDLIRTHRKLLSLLAFVLALAPFLHGHFGNSHDSGFHIDGLHAVHHMGNGSDPSLHADNDESPALGVVMVHPPSEDGHVLHWPVACLVALLSVPPLLFQCFLPKPPLQADRRTRYRVGFPPPNLAPPEV